MRLTWAAALLADKLEHLFERETGEYMGEDNPWGFRLDTPQYKYNRGELYNLSVRRGTLSDEEREERAQFAYEACVVSRERLVATDVFSHFGWDVEEARKQVLEGFVMSTFRNLLFQRVIPNLKRIGLLTDRIRPKFEELGILVDGPLCVLVGRLPA